MLSLDHWFNIIFIASIVTCAYALVRTKYGDDTINKICHMVKGVDS